MGKLCYTDDSYQTAVDKVSFWAKRFPSLVFHSKFVAIVFQASAKAKRGRYDNAAWAKSCLDVFWALESVGVSVEIAGIHHITQFKGPCVCIANHMSTLETAVLGGIIQPLKDVTFIVKQSLLEYPVFKHVMRSRDPIAVNRNNPREDLKAVLEGGCERLRNGISIIVFPQTTRTTEFDSAQFNTIGIKLAKKADVPVVPLALRTDAWGNGRYIKDFGKIDPSKKVYFHFGPPIRIAGRGQAEHEAVVMFITKKLREWAEYEGMVH
jgi:1-acyl-sn-glycerol-3-phosphate acyltransferase